MKIIIASPPKTGNIWLKCLLASIYRLEDLGEGPTADEDSLEKHIEEGWFKEHSIFHQHYYPSDRVLELASRVNAQLVTTIRNPYDVFVSLYYYVQNFPELFTPEHNLTFMLGKPIDHPEILAYIGLKTAGGFGYHVDMALNWIACKRSVIVPYERLRAHTFWELLRATNKIALANWFRISPAIDECSADVMRKKSAANKRHIRKASVGDYRNHLTAAHYEIFRSEYGEEIRALGYEVV